MPASDIGIDLGTRNSQVYSTGRGLVVSEPSVVAVSYTHLTLPTTERV